MDAEKTIQRIAALRASGLDARPRIVWLKDGNKTFYRIQIRINGRLEGHACASCKTENDADANFCKHCGEPWDPGVIEDLVEHRTEGRVEGPSREAAAQILQQVNQRLEELAKGP